MNVSPNTRHSLILRLRDREDVDSWREFVEIYEPLIYRVATRRGLQHADALELVQRVLLAVANAVDRFEPDRDRARFRTWLFRITQNEFCKQVAASRRLPAAGDAAIHDLLQQQPNREDEHAFSLEYRREVFRWAAQRVERDFRPRTWMAFWRTGVEGVSAESVAKELRMSVGAVYIARSRVMNRLRQVAQQFEESSE